jgi:hypothetical protein
MRSLVTHITAIATLFHLMVGCCGHASHGDDGHVCGHELAVEVCAHDHDHDHVHDDHHHSPACEPADGDGSLLASVVNDAESNAPSHECHGCDCAATTDANPSFSVGPDFLGFAWSEPAVIHALGVPLRSAWEPGDPPILAEIEPRLFERLLI